MVDPYDVHVHELQYHFHIAPAVHEVDSDQISRLGRL
jgi:hypothetical protein